MNEIETSEVKCCSKINAEPDESPVKCRDVRSRDTKHHEEHESDGDVDHLYLEL